MMATLLELINSTSFAKGNILTSNDTNILDVLLSNISLHGKNQINIQGKVIMLYGNSFTTISNHLYRHYNLKEDILRQYILSKYFTIDEFNNYIKKRKNTGPVNIDAENISLINNTNFNLLFDKSYNIYARTNRYDLSVSYFGNLSDYAIDKKILLHLKIKCGILIPPSITKAYVYDLLVNELSNNPDKFINQEPVSISNNKNQLCYNYFNLDQFKYNNENISASLQFLSQFEQDTQYNILNWLYNIFVADNEDRTILYIYGDGNTGKSVFTSAIASYLRNINKNLVMTISTKDNHDKFSLDGIDKARLIIYSDSNDKYLLQRPEILNITGADFIGINTKFKQSSHVQIYARIIITSNYKPNIDNNKIHELTRVLPCKIVNKVTKVMIPEDYKHKLNSEVHNLIAYAKYIIRK